MTTKAHWETDQWDDHPAGLSTSSMGAGMIAITGTGAPPAANDPNRARGLAAAAGMNAGLSNAQVQAAMAHAASLASSGVDYQTAAKQAVASQMNFFQKLLHFIAHPIQTTRAALHPQSTMHGSMPRMSDFGAPVNVQTGKAWYENQFDSIDWSR